MPEGTDQSWSTLHGAQAIASPCFQISEIPSAAVGQLVVLEMPPNVFGGVEFRGVGRELLDLDRALEGFEGLAHQRRAMRGQAVPDDEQGFADLTAQGVEKLDDLRTLDRPGKEPEVEAPEGDPGDDRELMPVEVILQDRGLAARCPSAHPGGPFAQSRLVDEDDDSALFCGVLFRTGQRVCFQRLIADSLRSSARPEGRWQEKPSETRMRHTWLSLYARPKRRSMSRPTRGSVHRSVGKPSANAPAFNACINSRRCACSSPEGRPRGRLFSPSNPPACNCAFHSDAVVRVTLKRRASSALATPRCGSRPARSRRRCNAFASRSVLSMLRLTNITYHVGPRRAKQVARGLCKYQYV